MIALGRILGGVAWLCTLLCILLTFIGMLAGNSVDAPILRYSATEFGDALNGYIKRGFTNSTVIQDNHVEGVWLAAPFWTQNYLSYCNNTKICDSRSPIASFSLRTQILAGETAALQKRFGRPDPKYSGQLVTPEGISTHYGISFDGQEDYYTSQSNFSSHGTNEEKIRGRIASNATFIAGNIGGDLWLWAKEDEHSLGAAYAFTCIALALEFLGLLGLPIVVITDSEMLMIGRKKVDCFELVAATIAWSAALAQFISASVVTDFITQHIGTSDPFKEQIDGATWDVTTSSTFLACTWIPFVLLLVVVALLIFMKTQQNTAAKRRSGQGQVNVVKNEEKMYDVDLS